MSENYQWELLSENYEWELSSENYDLVYHHAEKLRFIGILAYPKMDTFPQWSCIFIKINIVSFSILKLEKSKSYNY